VLKIEARNLPVVTGNRRICARGMGAGDRIAVRLREHRDGRRGERGRAARCPRAFVQTDVRTWGTGRPLFNARGEVIGINSQIYSRRAANRRVLRHPIDVATSRTRSSTGKVQHARLGVTAGSEPELADS
jgi:serine protease Do